MIVIVFMVIYLVDKLLCIFFILFKYEIIFFMLLVLVWEGIEKIDVCFYFKILVFFYCFFFWFLVFDFMMFYICCNEKKIVVFYCFEDYMLSC